MLSQVSEGSTLALRPIVGTRSGGDWRRGPGSALAVLVVLAQAACGGGSNPQVSRWLLSDGRTVGSLAARLETTAVPLLRPR